MGRSKDRLKPSQPPTQGKRIAPHLVPSDGSTNQLKPEFNLEFLSGAYGLKHCTEEEKAAFADRLHELGHLTWQEIQTAGRHGQGSEIITRRSLGDRQFPTEVTADVNILALRFSGKKPMVGDRRGRVFVILFLDRDFTLYQH